MNIIPAKLALVALLLGAAGGAPAFFIGKGVGRREAPRTITDRQACERWADRCRASKGDGFPWFDADGRDGVRCEPRGPDLPPIEVE